MADTTAASAASVCAACGQPATNRCVGCREGVDVNGDSLTTFYCSKTCQSGHWPTHKADCKTANARKHLYRVGDLGQQIFLQIRRATWTAVIDKVERVDGKLHVYEGEAQSDRRLVDFPTELFQNKADEAAVLSHGASDVALVLIQQMVYFSLGLECKC